MFAGLGFGNNKDDAAGKKAALKGKKDAAPATKEAPATTEALAPPTTPVLETLTPAGGRPPVPEAFAGGAPTSAENARGSWAVHP